MCQGISQCPDITSIHYFVMTPAFNMDNV